MIEPRTQTPIRDGGTGKAEALPKAIEENRNATVLLLSGVWGPLCENAFLYRFAGWFSQRGYPKRTRTESKEAYFWRTGFKCSAERFAKTLI